MLVYSPVLNRVAQLIKNPEARTHSRPHRRVRKTLPKSDAFIPSDTNTATTATTTTANDTGITTTATIAATGTTTQTMITALAPSPNVIAHNSANDQAQAVQQQQAQQELTLDEQHALVLQWEAEAAKDLEIFMVE